MIENLFSCWAFERISLASIKNFYDESKNFFFWHQSENLKHVYIKYIYNILYNASIRSDIELANFINLNQKLKKLSIWRKHSIESFPFDVVTSVWHSARVSTHFLHAHTAFQSASSCNAITWKMLSSTQFPLWQFIGSLIFVTDSKLISGDSFVELPSASISNASCFRIFQKALNEGWQ